MPSFTSLLLTLALLYLGTFLVATTYRNLRYGNEGYPHPWPFRYALASAVVEIVLTPPLAQHRARMKAVRQAEARRTAALAQAMGRHPASSVPRQSATTAQAARSAAETPASSEQFVARARATHVTDQVVASFRAAKAAHPATRAAVAAAKSVHSAETGRAAVAAG